MGMQTSWTVLPDESLKLLTKKLFFVQKKDHSLNTFISFLFMNSLQYPSAYASQLG